MRDVESRCLSAWKEYVVRALIRDEGPGGPKIAYPICS